jgi:hypothetical protein
MGAVSFHRVAGVEPLAGFRLLVRFCDGTEGVYDVSALFDRWGTFLALRDIPGLFGLVRVDAGGYGVSWNGELDISCEELYCNAALSDGAQLSTSTAH